MTRRARALGLLWTVLLAAAAGAAPVTPAPSGVIVLKFRAESGLTLGDDHALRGPAAAGAGLAAALADAAPGATLARRFTRPAADLARDRAAAAARSGRGLPDLTAWAELHGGPPAADVDGLEKLARRLRALPEVETAFPEPRAVPAALGWDAFTGRFTPPDGSMAAPGADKATPDFTALQGYKDNVQGVHALAVAGLPGADGAGVRVIDIEGAWLWEHEDLPAPFFTAGGQINDLGWRNHGTAVLGVIRGTDNGLGVTGIAPACEVGAAGINALSVPDALNTAAAQLSPGDVILIELHAPGPNADGNGQFGYVAMEYWQDNFDAIAAADALGVIVVEAAGNGQQDYDDPVYGTLFDPDVRHSGAVLVGAGTPAGDPEWYTNHGRRVDLNGWGSQVCTLAYGNLQGDPEPETAWYTGTFSGTSSASPVVVGSVVSLQGLVRQEFGTSLDSALMRQFLTETGTPQGADPRLIGPRPNIAAAWTSAQAGLGVLEGTVTSSAGGALAGAEVRIAGTQRRTVTDAAGHYGLGMPAGPVQVEIGDYFHADAVLSASITAGQTTTLDVVMNALPTVTLAGRVVGSAPLPLAGARVTPLDAPLPAVAVADGAWQIPGVPVDATVHLLVDGAPLFGADHLAVTPFDAGGGLYPVPTELRVVSQPFGNDGGWTAPGGVWAWGTPTTGPAGAFSPPACWGVGLHADTPDGAAAVLLAPSASFHLVDELKLSFHVWHDLEAGWDGVQLRILEDAGWTTLTPLGGYPQAALAALGNQPGWSGDSGGWRGVVFDLDAWIGRAVEIQLFFASDEAVGATGFFLDDVTWDTGDTIVAVDDLPTPTVGPTIAAHPNPFNPSTTVRWTTDAPGRLRVRVHDTRGRLVRDLLDVDAAAAGGVRWDGRDDHGRLLAAAPYLVRMTDAAGRSVATRVTLVK